MPPADERSALRLVARGFVALVIVLAAIPAYLTLAPGWRPLAARLACAILVAAVCVRLVRSVRASMEGPPSALETPPSRPPAPDVDERFLRLRDELRFSVGSRQYFETILWPQLQRIARTELPPPTERRRWRRDGPPLTSLERVIAAIERGA